MIKIEYPPYTPKIKIENGVELIFDKIRKRWIKLTPEEWVRQNFIEFLVQKNKVPLSLIGVEKEIIVNQLKKRVDLVVFDKNAHPWMLIECKEMNVQLSEKVFHQILQYYTLLQCPYLVITNGKNCIAYQNTGEQLILMKEIPSFS